MTLSERLQMDEVLTLDKAKKLVHRIEAVIKQQSFLKREETSLDYVKNKPCYFWYSLSIHISKFNFVMTFKKIMRS